MYPFASSLPPTPKKTICMHRIFPSPAISKANVLCFYDFTYALAPLPVGNTMVSHAKDPPAMRMFMYDWLNLNVHICIYMYKYLYIFRSITIEEGKPVAQG